MHIAPNGSNQLIRMVLLFLVMSLAACGTTDDPGSTEESNAATNDGENSTTTDGKGDTFDDSRSIDLWCAFTIQEDGWDYYGEVGEDRFFVAEDIQLGYANYLDESGPVQESYLHEVTEDGELGYAHSVDFHFKEYEGTTGHLPSDDVPGRRTIVGIGGFILFEMLLCDAEIGDYSYEAGAVELYPLGSGADHTDANYYFSDGTAGHCLVEPDEFEELREMGRQLGLIDCE